MGGTDHLVAVEQRGVLRRFLGHHVDARPGEFLVSKRVVERPDVDGRTPRGVHHDRVVVHPLERLRVEQVVRLVRERDVDGDEVGAVEQGVEVDLRDVVVGHLVGVDVRVVGDHVEVERARPPAEFPRDLPEPREAQRSPAEPVDGLRDGPVPPPPANLAVVARDLPDAGEQQRERVRRHLVQTVRRDVEHADAVFRGRVEVDAVDADAVPTDRREVQRLEHRLVDPRVLHEERVGPLGRLDDLRRRPRLRSHEFDARLGSQVAFERQVREVVVGDDDLHRRGFEVSDVGPSVSLARSAPATR